MSRTLEKRPSLAEVGRREKDNNEEFKIEREVLFQKVRTLRSVVRKQLVIPVELRLDFKIVVLSVRAHLGTTKTKEKSSGAEIVNVLLSENVGPEPNDVNVKIVYPNANPDIYDFDEIIREGSLKQKCTPEELGELERVLNRHRKLFSNDPGRTDLIEHNIVVISDQPIQIRPYRTSPRQTKILKQEIKCMLDLGVIEVGESDFSSPLILVEAPGKDPRPCIDYRKFNLETRAEYFPLPNIEVRFEAVASAKYISVIDLTKGY
ncbi:hypothetical protein AVEN_266549-1 [Araneus ventricosus]|uniref:Transposon Ty3-I Gag-Pol polyprotein n=1 Tax=Araneus ventricosus TaxID=182803 RepID=A0A4Y2TK20_ARAVE|nr:hypothetical protein AVEN_266549-1 [Araneus ventricosus]